MSSSRQSNPTGYLPLFCIPIFADTLAKCLKVVNAHFAVLRYMVRASIELPTGAHSALIVTRSHFFRHAEMTTN